jgi:hypothetical protein
MMVWGLEGEILPGENVSSFDLSPQGLPLDPVLNGIDDVNQSVSGCEVGNRELYCARPNNALRTMAAGGGGEAG